LTARAQLALATALLPLARAAGVPLLINDQVDIALAAGADGVHLGVDDLPVAAARRLLPDGIIGYSPETAADARQAAADGADYLGVGPFAVTSTKADAGAPIGSEGLAELAAATSLPVVAIGGVTETNAGAAVAAGAAGVAVVSAVVCARDPAAAARRLRTAVEAARSARGRE
jgi:thiamine-phosphate diphosphorylase